MYRGHYLYNVAQAEAFFLSMKPNIKTEEKWDCTHPKMLIVKKNNKTPLTVIWEIIFIVQNGRNT